MSDELDSFDDIAKLRADKELQIIRLVNPHDYRVKFNFKTEEENQALSIRPKKGRIPPRESILVQIKNSNPSNIGDINLSYWTRNDGEETKSKVPIRVVDMMGLDVRHLPKNATYSKTTLFFENTIRYMRPFFLVGLVVYNIVLIMINLYY